MSETYCSPVESVWLLAPLTIWLFLPICADTEERKLFFMHTQANKYITSGLNYNVWLVCQLFLSLAIWKFNQHIVEDTQLHFGIWFTIGVAVVFSWIALWVMHKFLLSVLLLLGGEIVAILFCVWAFRVNAYASVAAVLFTLIYSFQLITVWFYQKANKQLTIPNRDMGRFEVPSSRPNANLWIVGQMPHDHIILPE